jgi:hypothetical protein
LARRQDLQGRQKREFDRFPLDNLRIRLLLGRGDLVEQAVGIRL